MARGGFLRMARQRKLCDPRWCHHCGKLLVRRESEKVQDFESRKTCSAECASKRLKVRSLRRSRTIRIGSIEPDLYMAEFDERTDL